MSHFTFESALTDATRMDAPIQRGPLMRWQRKAMEAGVRNLSLSDSQLNMSGLVGPKSSCLKTPGKTPKTPHSARMTPKTPGKTPGKESGTPGRIVLGRTPGGNKKVTTGKTPSKKIGGDTQDRFIPNRSALDTDIGHHMLMNTENMDPDEQQLSPSKLEYHRKVSEALNAQSADHKILSFNQFKPPQAKDGHMNNLKVLYSTSTSSACKTATTRQIPRQPDRIMDAPELIDDYYLNLLSWSANNHLAVALSNAVYLWNASNGSITQLVEMENQDEYVSSVSWIKEGNILAIGNSMGSVQLWDVGAQKMMRTMAGHVARVGVLAWNSYILTSGSRSGQIHHSDVRVAQHHVATLTNHTQEVCGLAWSPDGRFLASGANDNVLNVWDASLSHDVAPLHTITQHQSAVKAVSWCPWQSNLLASGGGTADRHIRFWNTTTGACLNSVDTGSQVCSILWSKEYKELISGHGFSQNQLTIWKYPNMSRIANLTGHTARILCLAMSPDGSTVASAAGDETIRLWKCFAVDKQKKSSVSKTGKQTAMSSMLTSIR